MKTVVVCLLALIVGSPGVAQNRSPVYLGTSDALSRYSSELGKRSFLVFPETRENPIHWYDSIPEPRIRDGLSKTDFRLNANPGEYCVFQLGVWALKKDIRDVQVEYAGLKGSAGINIPASVITCFNHGGTDFRGRPFSKKIDVRAGRVQSLWLGIDLADIRAGSYRGVFTVRAGGEKQMIPITIDVEGDHVSHHGFDEGRRLSRLAWLNSTVGIDEEITRGYKPVAVDGNRVSILGRDMSIAPDGLPAQIHSYFVSSNQELSAKGEAIVQKPFRFIIQKENGESIRLAPGELTFKSRTPATTVWHVRNISGECDLDVTGQMEFDGFVDYHLKLTAKKPLKVKDIRMEVPVVPEKAEYMMGLGHEGGTRTPDWSWKWDVTKNQDMIWVGNVTGGIRVKLKAENYIRPLVNIYYAFGPLNLPPSWGNGTRGGVNVGASGNNVVINAYSGSRELKAGDVLNYDFELLITPFKTIDRKIKFNDRYFHGGGARTADKPEQARQIGANILNIHHNEDIYPFINYPYLDVNVPEIKALVDNAHKEGLRIKFYYTTRELTKNLPEFWAFNSLNGELIFPGPGNESRTEALHPRGPNEWLMKNLREKYIPAWYNLINEGKFTGEIDLSVITTPDSRLNNFYIAGLDWMVRNVGIDGVYIDDSALDHYTLRRARKIIDRYRPEGRLDLHSWNHFNAWAGFANCLNLYMDMLPYFDLVWIGEGRDYNRAPDHWLIEVSGIPFGLAGQMLEGGGNPWRGMVYGITNRAGWVQNSPEHLWRFFDEYAMSDKKLTGYWQKECPVRCSDSSVSASVFAGGNEHVIAVANWTDQAKEISLTIDWSKLGMQPGSSEVFIPAIQDFQDGQTAVSPGKLVLPGGKGLLIAVRRKAEK